MNEKLGLVPFSIRGTTPASIDSYINVVTVKKEYYSFYFDNLVNRIASSPNDYWNADPFNPIVTQDEILFICENTNKTPTNIIKSIKNEFLNPYKAFLFIEACCKNFKFANGKIKMNKLKSNFRTRSNEFEGKILLSKLEIGI